MSTPGDSTEDVFLPCGRLKTALFSEPALGAMREALRLTSETRWDCVRSPHIFMGLLAAPDRGVRRWVELLRADVETLLDQFQVIFFQEEEEHDGDSPRPGLGREFFSDNVLLTLREAHRRAADHGREQISPLDLLITLLTLPNSIVVYCFERISLSAAKLTQLAQLAEEQVEGA